jgi:N-glycosylase/DNA lyase
MEFKIKTDSIKFNLDHSLNCGQVFRWTKERDWWTGVVNGGAVKLKQETDFLKVKTDSEKTDENFIRNYFRLDDPLSQIMTSINKDEVIKRAISILSGLHLVNQDPWECTVSFMCATNKSIKSIKKIISNICHNFGSRINFEGEIYYAFPDPKAIALADKKMLESCGLGYRVQYVKKVANIISTEDVTFEDLKKAKYESARDILLSEYKGIKKFSGIGPKVADCILLFSLNKMNAFPIDIWIGRAILRFYLHLFDKETSKNIDVKIRKGLIDRSIYSKVSMGMRTYFGDYSGYAQEYLYHYTRLLNR